MSTTESQSAHGQPQSHLRKGEKSRNLRHLAKDAKQPAEPEAAIECLWKVQKQTVQTSRGESQWNSAPKPKAFSYCCHFERSWKKKKSPEFLLPKMQEKEINYSKFSLCPETPSHEAIPRASAKKHGQDVMSWHEPESVCRVCSYWTLSMANYVLF